MLIVFVEYFMLFGLRHSYLAKLYFAYVCLSFRCCATICIASVYKTTHFEAATDANGIKTRMTDPSPVEVFG